MIPLWKLKRELARIKQQLRLPFSLAAALVETRLRAGIGKRRPVGHRQRALRLSVGQIARLPDIALVLIYQPAGLPASLFETCRHLVTQGFAPFIVSNTALQADDRIRLLETSHLIMERPNVGYDFGGYRDGILHLLDAGVRPDNLLVMNDSIWFPLFDDATLLAEIRAQPHDLFGPLYNDRVRKPHLSHLQSYMFSFKRAAIDRPAFRTYWEGLVTSANKQLVIRMCEMRMTGAFRDAGFSVGYKWTAADGVTALRALPAADLRRALDYMGVLEPKFAQTLELLRAELVTDPATGPATAAGGEAAVLDALLDRHPAAPYLLKLPPRLLIDAVRLPFLKKDRHLPYQLQRAAFVQDPPATAVNPVIQAEISGWDRA